MPIADGLTSTKMIRSFEKLHPSHLLSQRASLNGRVPIIAVSATLAEKERDVYIGAGFDAWILKPINFTRLQELMRGIVDQATRKNCLYQPGHWEQGGWFRDAQPDVFSASTYPADDKQPYASSAAQAGARAEERVREELVQEEDEKKANQEVKAESGGPLPPDCHRRVQ